MLHCLLRYSPFKLHGVFRKTLMTFAGNYLAGTQCPPYHVSRSASNPLPPPPPPRLLSKPIESSEIWKILQCWQMMGVRLNFFLHACQRQHPDLLTFEGNISHAHRYALVIFCKCHRIASVTMTLVCYICLVSFQLVSLS